MQADEAKRAIANHREDAGTITRSLFQVTVTEAFPRCIPAFGTHTLRSTTAHDSHSPVHTNYMVPADDV